MRRTSGYWPPPRLNKVNMFRKFTRAAMKKASTVTYFGKPKSWSNCFYKRVMGYV